MAQTERHMAQGSKTQIFGLVAIVGLAVGLWLWLRPSAEPPTEGKPNAVSSAAAAASVDGPTAKVLRASEIDPLTAAKASVTGTVRDEAGQPIAGASVCATLRDTSIAGYRRFPPECATTREDGTYRLEGLLGTSQRLDASARGYLPRRYQARSGIQNTKRNTVDLVTGTNREGVDFVLEEGGVEVKGVVKDISGGEIEGAWVTAGGRWWGNNGSSFGRSGADGQFSLWVEPPEVNISAHAEGYGRGSRGAAVPGTFVELFLTPESVVVGKVVWADSGEPVANAKVSARSGMFGSSSGSAYSDNNGGFRIEGLEPGSYKVRVFDEELTGLADEQVHVGLGETSEAIVVRAHPAVTVRGTVLVDGKEPCSYGSVTLKETTRKKDWGTSNERKEDGSVLVKGLLPGTYEVSVSCEGFVAEKEYPDIVVADTSVTGLSWSVHGGQSIRGKVVDAEGKPIAGARVSARMKAGKDPRAQRSNSWGEQTEADGGFEVAGLLAGSYEVSARHDDYPSNDKPTETELGADTNVTDLVLSLPTGGNVEGTVRDEKGEPVSGVNIRLKGPRWGGGGQTNDDGRFIMENVETGDYRISAQRGWSDTMRAPGATDDDTAGERITIAANETK
ncbi:MAG: carboxypeptidase-like regulatory domain-containing protein, partial [Deltaproteobacteria bacterium]|nr:carboxypeptidase-like regulatory domain-containing protein [Deltaproteobacteria bacterium]